MTIGEKFATRDGTDWIVLDSMYSAAVGETVVLAERIRHYDRRWAARGRGDVVSPRFETFIESTIRNEVKK